MGERRLLGSDSVALSFRNYRCEGQSGCLGEKEL